MSEELEGAESAPDGRGAGVVAATMPETAKRRPGARLAGALKRQDWAIAQGVASVVERAGRTTGYATPVAYFGHAVAETNDDLKALIGAARAFPGPGFLLPARNGEMMRWCLAEGLRVTHTMTLMTIGLFNEPERAWLPSVLY